MTRACPILRTPVLRNRAIRRLENLLVCVPVGGAFLTVRFGISIEAGLGFGCAESPAGFAAGWEKVLV